MWNRTYFKLIISLVAIIIAHVDDRLLNSICCHGIHVLQDLIISFIVVLWENVARCNIVVIEVIIYDFWNNWSYNLYISWLLFIDFRIVTWIPFGILRKASRSRVLVSCEGSIKYLLWTEIIIQLFYCCFFISCDKEWSLKTDLCGFNFLCIVIGFISWMKIRSFE